MRAKLALAFSSQTASQRRASLHPSSGPGYPPARVIKHRMARLLAALVILLSSLLAAQASAAGPMSLGGDAMAMGQASDSGMADCGHAPAPACRIDCVLCHAMVSDGPTTRVTPAVYVRFGDGVIQHPPGVLATLDPPIPR